MCLAGSEDPLNQNGALTVECRCNCHNLSTAMQARHISPCCYKCQYCKKNIVSCEHQSHEKTCNARKYHILEIELGFFDQKREQWCKSNTGKFALIRGVLLYGFFDTQEDAYEIGCDIWGDAPFLIKEVQLVDKSVFSPTIFNVKAMEGDHDEGLG